jgi:AcrR family transcriptional regulator
MITLVAYHHGNLRQALIDAAVKLVQERGPEAVSVREVARLAGVSSGAPFRHFEDKVDLMAAVAEDGIVKLMETTARAVAAESDPASRFRAMGVAYVRFAVENPGHFRVVHKPEYMERSQFVRDANNNGIAMARMLIVEAQQAGSMRGGDPEAVLIAAQAMMYGLARMVVDGLFETQGISADRAIEMAELVTDQLGRGFRPPG